MKNAIKYFALVGYSDLNLDTETGARTLHARLRAASREVCVSFEGRKSMEQRIAWARCYSAALSGAVAQVNRGVSAVGAADRPSKYR
jgi:UrcA family protein